MFQSNDRHSNNRRDPGQSFGASTAAFPVRAGLLLFLAILIASSYSVAQEKKHSDPARSCVSGECHPAVLKHKHLHGPLKVGQCTVCHAPLPGTDHRFELIETEAALCLQCHKRVDTKGYMLHDPVAKGKCLGCHDPHGSEDLYQARKSPQVKMCDECHDPAVTRKYTHKPAAKGECLSCHRPHGNKAKMLLDTTGSRLCLEQCHEKMRPVRVGGREQKIHLADEDCSRCHRSHDSSLPALLTRSPAQLCLDGCHKEIKEHSVSSQVKHDAMTEKLACVECHRAHDNKLGSLLRKPAKDLCFACHDEVQSQIEAQKFKHRPVADKSCLSCHTPHDSSYGNLLFADYPPGDSLPYDPASYAFCFSCHAEKIVRERHTETDTEFRNGRLNLHNLHVNVERGGQTCRACHGTHAGSQPRLIRDKNQFGNLEISLRFKKSDTGGSCLVGCHEEYAYDRANPVQLRAQ